MNPALVLAALLKALFLLGFVLTLTGVLTWADRRQGAMHQDRIGPERAVVWLPTWLAQLLMVLPALLVATGAVYLPLGMDAQGPARNTQATLFSHLAVFMLWATALALTGRIRKRGVRHALDAFLASLGEPRRILYVGLAAHALLVLAGVLSRGTETGQLLREIGYRSGTSVFAFAVLAGAAYTALSVRGTARVGVRALGLFHLVADGIKTAFKEDLVPPRADRFLFGLAPFLAMVPVLVVLAVVPFGDTLCFAVDSQGSIDFGHLLPSVPREGVCRKGAIDLMVWDANVGFLFVLAITGTGVVGMAIAGGSSDNKFSLLGGLRAASQMVSYEVTLGLAAVGALMTYGTLELDDMVRWQADHTWGLFVQPLGCILFFAAMMAESKRIPFDLPEGESEIVAGHMTEYSGMKFAMFYFAEYAAVVVVSALMTTLYLGGWHIPFVARDGLHLEVAGRVLLEGPLPHVLVVGLGMLAFGVKTVLLCWLQVGVRWTLPRFRFDQLMRLGWRILLPTSLVNILATGLVLLLVWNAGPAVHEALGWAGEVSQTLVLVAGLAALGWLVHYWLRPTHKTVDPPTSAVRFATAAGGTRSARMGA
ncbi:NADH-quinone oxidoreductase subunit H [Myxococcota bacterium]